METGSRHVLDTGTRSRGMGRTMAETQIFGKKNFN